MSSTAVLSPEKFEHVVSRILQRVDLTEGHEGDEGVDAAMAIAAAAVARDQQQAGPLTVQELADLSLLCTAAHAEMAAANDARRVSRHHRDASNGSTGFAVLETDQLVGLMTLLNRHVNLAVAVNVFEAASELGPSASKSVAWKAIKELRGGLEAAAIILHIVSTPGLDRCVIDEDVVKATITLARLHISKHLVPAINRTGSFANSSGNDGGQADGKRRRNSSGAPVKNEAAAVTLTPKVRDSLYTQVIDTATLQLVLMNRLEDLVDSLPLEDQELLLITNGCLMTLAIECIPGKSSAPVQLQKAAIGVVTAAFRKYPLHRTVILEDLFPVMLNIPTGKKSLRCFAVRYSSSPSKGLEALNTKLVGQYVSNALQPHSIQMVTALVFSLVQACVIRPIVQIEDEDDKAKEPNDATGYKSGFGQCQAVVNAFVTLLLAHCKNKATGGIAYRTILSNLVEDCFLTIMIPEYPAAEPVLSAIQQRLNHDLAGAKNSKNNLEVTYQNYAFDVLGKMCAAQARFLAEARGRPINVTTDVSMSSASSDEQEVKCLCGKSLNNVFLIQCDGCNKFMHGPCVGFAVETNVPDVWFCDSCCLGNIARAELRDLSDTDATYVDPNFVMFHSFLSATASQLSGGMVDATKVHLVRWFDEIERKMLSIKSERPPVRIFTQLSQFWDTPPRAAQMLSDDGCMRVILGLMAGTLPFLLSFKNQMGFILNLMSDENTHTLRKSSLKAIEKCVEGDQSLMLLPIVRRAVSLRLADESISVREAAVSLVGNYIAKSPLAIDGYHAALVPCLSDPGVSVRKRAMKIFQSIISDNPHFRGRSTVCNIMLQRSADPKEEDGVRDLIHEVFSVLWLRESRPGWQHPSIERSVQVQSEQGVVTPDAPVVSVKRSATELKTDMVAEQMMEVVQAAGTGTYLEAMLQKLLKGGIDSDSERKQIERQRRQELGQKQCAKLVDSLFELLVTIDEQRKIRENFGKDIAATLATIAVFANVAARPVLRRVETVLLYLKADNGVKTKEDEVAIVCASCDILFRLSPVFDSMEISKLSKTALAKDLSRITFTYGPTALVPAVRAFATLANFRVDGGESHFAQKLLEVAQRFYGFAADASSMRDFSPSNAKQLNKVHRSLTTLGLICEYREVAFDSSSWEDEIQADAAPSLISESLSWDNYTLACYRLFWLYLLKDDLPTKCKALSSLKGIFVSHPQLLLMMDHIGLFDMVMSDEAGVPLQLEALACWQSILEAEEIRIDSGKAEAKMDEDGNVTLSKRVSGDQNGDATLFGGVLTNHAERLFEMSQSQNPTIRLATLRLVGLLLRQGLVNPNEAVPHLFALQGDVENEAIRSLALMLLMAEGEKRPEVLRQRICSGIKQAYAFQRAIYPNKGNVSAVVKGKNGHVESIFGRVFEECISKNQKNRLGLYRSLLSLFELENLGGSRDSKSAPKDLALLSFAAQVLAHLPYTTAVDPLFITHRVDNLYTSQGLQVIDRFADFFRQQGLYGNDEFEGDISSEDVLEKAAKSKFPSRAAGARPLSSKSFPVATMLDHVRDGAVVTLLLRLKKFLCKPSGYNISSARLLEYDPNTKERLCDKGIPKVKFSEPFDAKVAPVLLEVDGTIDKDALIREYAAIRQQAREEGMMDTSASSTENDDQNLKPAAAPRKRTRSEAEHSDCE